MKKYFLLILLLYQSFFSQNTTGVFNDGFIFTNAVQGNPSSFLQNSNPWEVNVISSDIFFSNNYGYISKEHLLGFSRDSNFTINNNPHITDVPKNTVAFKVHNSFDGHFQVNVLGPAFAMKFKIKDNEFAAGFYTRLRTFGNAFNVDEEYKHENFVEQPEYNRLFHPFSASIATLQENNFFLSKSFYQTKTSELNVGVNFKQSKVWDALVVKEKNSYNIEYSDNDDLLHFSNFNGEVMVANSYNFDKNRYEPKNNGSSIGGDIGFTYIDYGDYDKEEGKYLQKLAFSVTDIGMIKIKGEKHVYEGNPFYFHRDEAFQNVNNVDEFLHELSSYVYNNPETSLVATEFTVALPTAMHLSYSGNLLKNRYITVGVNQRLPLYKYSFKMPNLFYVNFAKSTRQLTYSAQFSMFEYKKPQLGAYIRFGPFFIGSDNILPVFFDQKEFDSFDIYFGIKIYPFWDNEESRRYKKDCDCER